MNIRSSAPLGPETLYLHSDHIQQPINQVARLSECINTARVWAVNEHGRIGVRRHRDLGVCKAPGGTLEPGESVEEALCREFEEEMGFLLNANSLRPLCEIVEIREGGKDKQPLIKRSSFFIGQVLELGTAVSDEEAAKGYDPEWVGQQDALLRVKRLGNYPDQFSGHVCLREQISLERALQCIAPKSPFSQLMH